VIWRVWRSSFRSLLFLAAAVSDAALKFEWHCDLVFASPPVEKIENEIIN
jgi:hypothetical protein